MAPQPISEIVVCERLFRSEGLYPQARNTPEVIAVIGEHGQAVPERRCPDKQIHISRETARLSQAAPFFPKQSTGFLIEINEIFETHNSGAGREGRKRRAYISLSMVSVSMSFHAPAARRNASLRPHTVIPQSLVL